MRILPDLIKRDRGFTLIEIMVVVSIIALLAGLSISMMLRNRVTANETVAITSCRTIVSVCQSYYANTMPHQYPASLAVLGVAGVTGPAYIDTALASGSKAGYLYSYQLTTPASFVINADPQVSGRTGERYFYSDETGRITAAKGGQAGAGDISIN